MGRRWIALLGKEVRQHWLAALALLCLLGLGLLCVLGAGLTAKRSMTVLEGQLFFLWTFVPLAAIVLGNRLVVAEWYSRTQLFVEALPLPKGEQVLVKFLFGLTLLEGAAFASLGLVALLALRTEPVEARFFAILETRTALFVGCAWSFFFFMGFLGRLRIVFYIAFGMGLAILESATEIHLTHFGPFALVSHETFGFERHVFPVDEIATTAAITLTFVALSGLLATLNEGSLAEVLSRRMSQKEKVTAGIIFVVELLGLFFVQQRAKKKPFELSGSMVCMSARKSVGVFYAEPSRLESGRALAASLEAELETLRPLLVETSGVESERRPLVLPPVRIAFDAGLDARTFETAKLQESDGILVRAHFGPRDARDAAALEAYVVREVINGRTTGRARFEPKRWVHDGFARWWVERGTPAGNPLVLRRALWATRHGGPDPLMLEKWNTTREQLGETVAEAVAWSGLRALEVDRGRDAVLQLARELFAREVPKDFTETWRERTNPMHVVFERATGLEWGIFLDHWRRWLDSEREEATARAALERVPEGRGSLAFERGVGLTRTVNYTFDFERPPAPGTLCSLVHDRLGPFDFELRVPDLKREEHAWEAGATRATWDFGGFGEGERAFLALEVDSEELACPLRLVTLRTELE